MYIIRIKCVDLMYVISNLATDFPKIERCSLCKTTKNWLYLLREIQKIGREGTY
jgi:hypothetical protein